MSKIEVLQLPGFKRAYKMLQQNQRHAVNNAITTILDNSRIGQEKKGDLSKVWVYKFNCVNQQFLIAYEYDPKTLTLLAIGLHENFYRDLKEYVN